MEDMFKVLCDCAALNPDPGQEGGVAVRPPAPQPSYLVHACHAEAFPGTHSRACSAACSPCTPHRLRDKVLSCTSS